MTENLFTIIENEYLAKGTWRMVLGGDCASLAAPGRFVNVKLPGFFLRRPISVCDVSGDELTLVYKTVGHGTEAMSRMLAGDQLSLLTGLGNGFDLSASGNAPLLLGGGAGAAPLFLLAKKLLAEAPQRPVTAVLGFNTADEVFYAGEFASLGVRTFVMTADGTVPEAPAPGGGLSFAKGFVTDAPCLSEAFSYYYACGPMPMLKAVFRGLPCAGELSFEERMGCGFGACVGCTMETKEGPKRVCKDGPVFRKEVLTWQT